MLIYGEEIYPDQYLSNYLNMTEFFVMNDPLPHPPKKWSFSGHIKKKSWYTISKVCIFCC